MQLRRRNRLLLTAVLRYTLHTVAGATVWAGLSIPTEAALSFSFAYNATYMIPETIVLLVTTIYIASNIDFKAHRPTRLQNRSISAKHGWISPTAGLIGLIAVITDTVIVFRNIQDEDGNFVIESLLHVNWTLVIAITAVAVLIVCALLAIGKVLSDQSKQ
jgi:thiamine transporter